MTDLEELREEIAALVDAVQIDRFEALALQMDPAARADVRRHIQGRISELKKLLARLDALSKPN